jgi:phage-related protein
MDIIRRKRIEWIGDSRDAIRGFPEVAKQRTGRELARVQEGLEPTDRKPMPSIGLGVSEIRVREDSGAFRVIYVAKFAEAIYVLHAFQKKGRKTPKAEIELARKRYRAILNERKL